MACTRYITLHKLFAWMDSNIQYQWQHVVYINGRFLFDLRAIKLKLAQEYKCEIIVLIHNCLTTGIFRQIDTTFLSILASSLKDLPSLPEQTPHAFLFFPLRHKKALSNAKVCASRHPLYNMCRDRDTYEYDDIY